jgi:hypothetical protein
MAENPAEAGAIIPNMPWYSSALSEPFGDSWRIAEEGHPLTARRCSCPQPLLDRDSSEFETCMLCGRESSIRLPGASESASAAMNGNGAGDSLPESAPDAASSPVSETPELHQPPGSASHKNGRPDGTLSLVELGELVEQFPAIDWSPVIVATAREERVRAAAYSERVDTERAHELPLPCRLWALAGRRRTMFSLH